MTAPSLPGGRPRVAPDPHRSSPAAWAVTGAALTALLAAAFACEPARSEGTPTDEPGPAVTAPEGDAGGASGGWTE